MTADALSKATACAAPAAAGCAGQDLLDGHGQHHVHRPPSGRLPDRHEANKNLYNTTAQKLM
jgi:hypothetical protein